MQNKNSNQLLNTVKSELIGAPFTTVFKATLGFYAAQALISLVVLGGIGALIAIGVLLMSL